MAAWHPASADADPPATGISLVRGMCRGDGLPASAVGWVV